MADAISAKNIALAVTQQQMQLVFDQFAGGVTLTLAELQEKLGDAIPRYTLRRILQTLMLNNAIEVLPFRKGREYVYGRRRTGANEIETGIVTITFRYGSRSGTAAEFANALASEAASIRTIGEDVAGIIAHIWMRSYASEIETPYKDLTKPSAIQSREELVKILERVRQFQDFVKELISAPIWSDDHNTFRKLHTESDIFDLMAVIEQAWLIRREQS